MKFFEVGMTSGTWVVARNIEVVIETDFENTDFMQL